MYIAPLTFLTPILAIIIATSARVQHAHVKRMFPAFHMHLTCITATLREFAIAQHVVYITSAIYNTCGTMSSTSHSKVTLEQP